MVALSIGGAILAMGEDALAQGAATDVERTIEARDANGGPGSLLATLHPDATEQRRRLQKDGGLAFTFAYSVYAQSALEDGADVVSGSASLGLRWTLDPGAATDNTSIVALVENRHNMSSATGFDLLAATGSAWFANPIPNDGHTRLRQLYLKRNLAGDQVVLGIGKFSTRALFNQSAVTGDRFRSFIGFPYILEPSFSPPVDAAGMYVRVQPDRSRASLSFAVLDARPSLDGVDFEIEHPFYATEIAIGSRPWKSDSGTSQPPWLLRFTGYYSDDPDRRGWGAAGVLDIQATENWSIGWRGGISEKDLGPVSATATLAAIRAAPFGRLRDGFGVGTNWARDNEGDDQYAVEVFYRWNVTPGFEISPSLQLIVDPTASNRNTATIIGLRTFVSF